MGPTRMSFSKPVIAAISGYAVAGGLELAAMCDLRVVEEGAVLGVFCRRVGIPLIDGGTIRLPRLIGLSRALDLDPDRPRNECARSACFGLANRVVREGAARPPQSQLATELAAFPQAALLADRRSALENSMLEDLRAGAATRRRRRLSGGLRRGRYRRRTFCRRRRPPRQHRSSQTEARHEPHVHLRTPCSACTPNARFQQKTTACLTLSKAVLA